MMPSLFYGPRTWSLAIVASFGFSSVAIAQSQSDLDTMSAKCGLPSGKFELKGNVVVLHASNSDTPQAMACSRAEVEKVPGLLQKLAVDPSGLAQPK